MIAWRIKVFFLRLFDYVITLPQRAWRLIRWIFFITHLQGKNKLIRRLTGIFVLTVDLTPIPFFIETILDWVKIRTRSVTKEEKQLIVDVFGKKIPVHLIGMDPASIPAIRRKTVAYVLFHTVNFDKNIQDTTMIHELVHVWQYRRYGSVYITEALWAQKWGGGYNYGGLDALKKFCDDPGLSAFNFEQQADIIEEYYRWKKGLALQWSVHDVSIGEVLEKYQKCL